MPELKMIEILWLAVMILSFPKLRSLLQLLQSRRPRELRRQIRRP